MLSACFAPSGCRYQPFERAVMQSHGVALAFHGEPQDAQRANSSGFTVVLPIDLSVSHASSKAVSKSTSVGGSKELLWNPRMAPSSIVSYGYGHIRVILESFGAK